MRTLIGYYTDAVVSEYQAKKMANTLSLRLVHPTPAKLKEECKVVCRDRFERKDYPILKTFFGEAADVKACLVAIGKCEIDKFKPLLNFINGKVNDPHPTTVELLAWLIDFKDRPFDDQKKYDNSGNGKLYGAEVTVKEEKIDKDSGFEKNQGSSEKEKNQGIQVDFSKTEKKVTATSPPLKSTTFMKVGAAAMALAILLFVTFRIFRPKPVKDQAYALTGHEACMYWTGDHYQPISCSQKLDNTLIIALDSIKLNYLKRITRPDTITSNAIGYVWYAKIDGKHEFYTDSGSHPVNLQYRLRPITQYIIDKHIKPGGQPE